MYDNLKTKNESYLSLVGFTRLLYKTFREMKWRLLGVILILVISLLLFSNNTWLIVSNNDPDRINTIYRKQNNTVVTDSEIDNRIQCYKEYKTIKKFTTLFNCL